MSFELFRHAAKRYNEMTTDPTIGSSRFIDGVERPVFLDCDGRQYLLNDDQKPVYGEWIYVDEPEIVTRDTVQS